MLLQQFNKSNGMWGGGLGEADKLLPSAKTKNVWNVPLFPNNWFNRRLGWFPVKSRYNIIAPMRADPFGRAPPKRKSGGRTQKTAREKLWKGSQRIERGGEKSWLVISRKCWNANTKSAVMNKETPFLTGEPNFTLGKNKPGHHSADVPGHKEENFWAGGFCNSRKCKGAEKCSYKGLFLHKWKTFLSIICFFVCHPLCKR